MIDVLRKKKGIFIVSEKEEIDSNSKNQNPFPQLFLTNLPPGFDQL